MDSLITTYEVAAFTDSKSAGSPTGVVLDAGHLNSDQMQFIAQQLPFSHTAFVSELEQDGGSVSIRFFTATGEIKNCAHATIAAHYLRASELSIHSDVVLKQQTLSGVQEVEVHCCDGAIIVYFQQNQIAFSDVDRAVMAELLSILKLPEAALDNQYPVILASPGAYRFLVAVQDSATLKALTPSLSELKIFCDRLNSIGCFVFTVEESASSVQATARMFAPSIGVDEDVINGNSSGCLGAYLLHLDRADTIKSEVNLSVHQGQAFNRLGIVLVKAKRVGDKIETVIGGTAVIVSKRQISLSL